MPNEAPPPPPAPAPAPARPRNPRGAPDRPLPPPPTFPPPGGQRIKIRPPGAQRIRIRPPRGEAGERRWSREGAGARGPAGGAALIPRKAPRGSLPGRRPCDEGCRTGRRATHFPPGQPRRCGRRGTWRRPPPRARPSAEGGRGRRDGEGGAPSPRRAEPRPPRALPCLLVADSRSELARRSPGRGTRPGAVFDGACPSAPRAPPGGLPSTPTPGRKPTGGSLGNREDGGS